jgi:hypothetical protein
VARSGTTWTFAQEAVNLTRGPRHSARQHIPFLHQEFVDMIRKGQWTLLPARLVLNELQLRLSPLGVVISLESTTINWLYPLMSACSLARHCGECSGNSNRLIFIWGLCIYPRSTLPTGFTVSGFERVMIPSSAFSFPALVVKNIWLDSPWLCPWVGPNPPRSSLPPPKL